MTVLAGLGRHELLGLEPTGASMVLMKAVQHGGDLSRDLAQVPFISMANLTIQFQPTRYFRGLRRVSLHFLLAPAWGTDEIYNAPFLNSLWLVQTGSSQTGLSATEE